VDGRPITSKHGLPNTVQIDDDGDHRVAVLLALGD
jgi:hypothetical protein